MISRSIDRYVFFGANVRYLQDASANTTIHGFGYILHNIDAFISNVTNLNLSVTDRASTDLRSFADRLRALPQNAKLTNDLAKELRTLIQTIGHTLFAELAGAEAFVTTPKRLDVQRLLNGVPDLFGPNVFAKLPAVARYDLNEAGKCIAFERSTAAAFHLLRATEAVLRSFYCALARQKRVSQMWGPMILDLQRRQKAKPYETLLNHLDIIRQSFRNPTQHPDKIYDIQEVQDLWGLCVDAVNRMAQVL